MTDREQLLGLLNRYAFTVDGGDMDAFSELYARGEWSIAGQTPHRGAREIRDNILSDIIIYEDGTPRTRHVTSNIDLSISESGESASAQRYVAVLQGAEAIPLQVIFTGHYHDDFLREDGQWHFAQTVVHGPIFGDMSRHLRTLDLAGA